MILNFDLKLGRTTPPVDAVDFSFGQANRFDASFSLVVDATTSILAYRTGWEGSFSLQLTGGVSFVAAPTFSNEIALAANGEVSFTHVAGRPPRWKPEESAIVEWTPEDKLEFLGGFYKTYTSSFGFPYPTDDACSVRFAVDSFVLGRAVTREALEGRLSSSFTLESVTFDIVLFTTEAFDEGTASFAVEFISLDTVLLRNDVEESVSSNYTVESVSLQSVIVRTDGSDAGFVTFAVSSITLE